MERDPRTQGHAEIESDDSTLEDNEENSASSIDTNDEIAEDDDLSRIQEELEAERQRSAEYLDQAQRARAELVNYRRRTEEEVARMQQQAGERIIARLLPVLDDLNRALELLSEEERNTSWAEGIELIQRKMWSTMEAEGVRPIESLGHPFDPSLHEAISMQDGANGATTVVQEFQRGYMLGDRVIRPAMVVVGSPDDMPETGASEDESTHQSDNNEEP